MEKHEKKPNIFTQIGNWWKSLNQAEKNGLIGIVVGGACGFAGSMMGVRHWQNKFIEQTEREFDAGNKLVYLRGVKDGQIKAYHDLLIKPEIGMHKLGMDVKKF